MSSTSSDNPGICPRTSTVVALFIAYLLVSAVAYTDYPRSRHEEPVVLNDLERQGLQIWRDNNCQACHQLYGFGGFLGPDLTNQVSEDRSNDEFRSVLSEGSPPMPAFGFSDVEQDAVLAYLRAMDRTGQGMPDPLAIVLPVAPPMYHGHLLDVRAEQDGLETPAQVLAGREVWETRACGACHRPYMLGVAGAKDLASDTIDRSPEYIAATTALGPGAMPVFDLSREETERLSALLSHFAEERVALSGLNDSLVEREAFSLSGLPWWEFGE
jgi:nitric oxide reductase subunit C